MISDIAFRPTEKIMFPTQLHFQTLLSTLLPKSFGTTNFWTKKYQKACNAKMQFFPLYPKVCNARTFGKILFSNFNSHNLIGIKTSLRRFMSAKDALVILHSVQNSFCYCFQIF